MNHSGEVRGERAIVHAGTPVHVKARHRRECEAQGCQHSPTRPGGTLCERHLTVAASAIRSKVDARKRRFDFPRVARS